MKEKLAFKARVLREGKWVNIPSKNIVPGDIVKVHLGDIVPADIKLIEGEYVTVDESSLTGESLPVDKTVDDIIIFWIYHTEGADAWNSICNRNEYLFWQKLQV